MIRNRPSKTLRAVLLVALATMYSLLAPVVATAQDDSPQWRFQSENEFDVVLTQATRIQSQVDQRVKDVNNELTLNMKWQVQSVDENGTATIEMTIVSVQMKMDSMPNGVGKSIDIDTSSDEVKKGAEGELLKQLAPLMGATVVIEMTARGEISKTEVPESTLEALRTAPGSMKLRTILESDGIKDVFGQSMVVFPENLKQGEPWSTDNQLDTGFGKYQVTHTNLWTGTRSSETGQLAEFELKSSIQSNDERDKTQSRLAEFSGQGELVFDVTEGFCVSSKSTNEMKTEQPYREKTISTSVTTVVEMLIKKK